MYNKHGMRYSPEYKIWSRLKYGVKHNNLEMTYKWSTFVGFLKDMGQRPSPKHVLKRKCLYDGYSKDNCIWSTERGGRTLKSLYWVEYRRKKKLTLEQNKDKLVP